MVAYVIVEIEIADHVRYEDYKKLAAPTVIAHGGKYVIRGGKVETLEGSWKPGRIVVLEFPTMQHAREWWASESYRPAKELRQAIAKTRMIAVEGV